MRNKILALVLACIIGASCVGGTEMLALAKEGEIIEENLDFSYFTVENSLFGYTNMQTRGVYLACGDAAISKISSYKIGATGETTAATRCDVSLTVIVERYNMETDRWGFITSWTAEKENAFYVAISKSLVVDSGYYYRVRCLHYAGSDASSSCTNALYVGN